VRPEKNLPQYVSFLIVLQRSKATVWMIIGTRVRTCSTACLVSYYDFGRMQSLSQGI
jgi:hypothetical protein